MLHTLQKIDQKVISLFPSRDYQLCLDALVEGICEGDVVVDDLESPRSGAVAIYPKSREEMVYVYLFGKRQYEFIASFREYFDAVIKSGALERGLIAYQFYPLSGWTIIDRDNLIVDSDKYYLLNPEKHRQKFPDWKKNIPRGFTLKKIDREEVFNEVSTFWKNYPVFREKGFSYYITRDETNELVAHCHNKYVTRTACEPGIETKEEYRRKGFGTLVACAVIEEALDRELRVVWECWRGNEASIRMATKLGFEYSRDAEFHIGYFDELQHYWNAGYFYLTDMDDALKATKYFTSALELNETLKRPITPFYYYLAARALAMTERNPLALDCLRKALDAGENESRTALKSRILDDPAFFELKQSSKFQELF